MPFADHVRIAAPNAINPFAGTGKIEVNGPDHGLLRDSSAFSSPGETARLVRDRNSKIREVWLGAFKLQPERRVVAELKRKYARLRRRRSRIRHHRSVVRGKPDIHRRTMNLRTIKVVFLLRHRRFLHPVSVPVDALHQGRRVTA